MTTTRLTQFSADELREYMAQNAPELLDKPQDQEKPAPAKKRICVAILSYDGRIVLRSALCLPQIAVKVAQEGWDICFIHRDGDSMVARGRNFLASQMLSNPNLEGYTDLVFIDTDLAFKPDDFIRLCKHDVDVVGGCYPYKHDDGNFPLRWPSHGLCEDNGLWEVAAVTPGFLRITRRALAMIAAEKPWLEFKDRGGFPGQRFWMFFDNIQRPQGVFDEGYVFCEHWRSLGGTVYMDPDIEFEHIGLKSYKHGTIREWLDKKAAALSHLESEYPHVPPLKLLQKTMGVDVDLDKEQPSSPEEIAAQKQKLRALTPEQRNEVIHEGASLATDDKHSDERPAGTAGSNGAAHPPEYKSGGYDLDALPGFGRSADDCGGELAGDRPGQAIDPAKRGLAWREIRQGANGSAGRHLPSGG